MLSVDIFYKTIITNSQYSTIIIKHRTLYWERVFIMTKKKKILKEIFGFIKVLAVGFVFALIINNYMIVNAVVISGSMESTVMTDSRVIGSRLVYAVSEPQRFDIILLRFPDDETREPFLKRIIGLPNEKVEIRYWAKFTHRISHRRDCLIKK